MSYRVLNPRTDKAHRELRAALRAWRPRLSDLMLGGIVGRSFSPSATKRGPGRKHVQGYSRRRARIQQQLESDGVES